MSKEKDWRDELEKVTYHASANVLTGWIVSEDGAKKILTEMEAELERLKQGGWVSVEERLPEEGERVLVVTSVKVVSPSEFRNKQFGRYPNYTEGDRCMAYTFANVTHWQPLPSAPGQEQK